MKNLVIVVFPAKEDKFEELKNTLKEALVDTRAFEGCISIDTYEDFSASTIYLICLLYTSPSPRDRTRSRMPSSA